MGIEKYTEGDYDRRLYWEGSRLYKMGITRKNMSLRKQKKYYEILKKIASFGDKHDEFVDAVNASSLNKNWGYIPAEIKYKLLATGSSAIVLFRELTIRAFKDGKFGEDRKESAFKFSSDIRKEYRLLKLLKKSKNVVHALSGEHKAFSPGVYDIGDYIELEYIKGDSLESILKRKRKLASDTILKYSAGVMNGLNEMRRAGILYHRDIRPANIMIDTINNEAVILDLEYATKNIQDHKIDSDPDGKPHNRRFNGPSDLSSVGQLMYYMATGTSLFTDKKIHKRDLSDLSEEILEKRNKFYADKKGHLQNHYMRKIDTNIQDRKLAYLIKQCLVSDHTDVERIYKLFEKVVE